MLVWTLVGPHFLIFHHNIYFNNCKKKMIKYYKCLQCPYYLLQTESVSTLLHSRCQYLQVCPRQPTTGPGATQYLQGRLLKL